MPKKIDLVLDDGTTLSVIQGWSEFARHFALTGNATQSRIDAGYKEHPNKQINTNNAWNMLQKPDVQRAYEYHKARLARKMDISENRILAELAAIGFSNVAHLFKNGQLKDIETADMATQRAIKSVKIRKTFEGVGDDAEPVEYVAIEMHPKITALKHIAELKGMTDPDDKKSIAVTVNIDGKQVTAKEE